MCKRDTDKIKSKIVMRILVPFSVLALLVPFALIIRILLINGVNSPYWDEWDIVSKYREFCENHFDVLKLIGSRCNEHRIPIPTAIQMLIWSLTNMNDRAVMIISQLFSLSALGIIAKYLWNKYQSYIYITILPVSVLLFHLKLVHLFLWASCNMWFIMYFFACYSFYLFDKALSKNDDRCFFGSLFCAAAASLCAANGLLTWLAILFFILLCRIFDSGVMAKKHTIITIISAVFVYVAYFFNWGRVETTTSRVHSIRQFLITCTTTSVGAFFEINQIDIARVVGVVLLVIIIGYIVAICWKTKQTNKHLLVEMAFPILSVVFFSALW